MTDTSVQYHAVAKTGDIDEDEAMRVAVGRKEIALYNLGGEIYATDDICTHAYASMSDGYVEGDQIECPLHGACFEIKTGKPANPPVTVGIETYPVKIEGNTVLIGMKSEG